MLPPAHRLRRREDFAVTVRRGRRSGARDLVVHVLPAAVSGLAVQRTAATRVGFVVGRGVGGAVVRNRVRRRLQHVVAERWALLPEGSTVVVRALPGAAGRTSPVLAAQLERSLARTAGTSR